MVSDAITQLYRISEMSKLEAYAGKRAKLVASYLVTSFAYHRETKEVGHILRDVSQFAICSES